MEKLPKKHTVNNEFKPQTTSLRDRVGSQPFSSKLKRKILRQISPDSLILG